MRKRANSPTLPSFVKFGTVPFLLKLRYLTFTGNFKRYLYQSQSRKVQLLIAFFQFSPPRTKLAQTPFQQYTKMDLSHLGPFTSYVYRILSNYEHWTALLLCSIDCIADSLHPHPLLSKHSMSMIPLRPCTNHVNIFLKILTPPFSMWTDFVKPPLSSFVHVVCIQPLCWNSNKETNFTKDKSVTSKTFPIKFA